MMVEGRSEWEAARYFGINRKTVKKMCQYAVPPVIGASASSFHLSLRDSLASLMPFWKLTDKVHVKQRHTTVRILKRLRDEQVFWDRNN